MYFCKEKFRLNDPDILPDQGEKASDAVNHARSTAHQQADWSNRQDHSDTVGLPTKDARSSALISAMIELRRERRRRVYDIVRDDLLSMGLCIENGYGARVEQFAESMDEPVQLEIQEFEEKFCLISLSAEIAEKVDDLVYQGLGDLILIGNRREWRVVKPLIRSCISTFRNPDRMEICQTAQSRLVNMTPDTMREIFPKWMK